MTDPELIDGLSSVLVELDRQIRMVKMTAEDLGQPYWELRNNKNEYLIQPLLVAKADVLHSLALMRRT